MAILDKAEARDLYDGIAGSYDRMLLGFRPFGLERWRADLIEDLDLDAGDQVVDLCCGTGENLPLLHKAVGSSGRIIGVDLSANMLAEAQRKADRGDMHNVVLHRGDVEQFELPHGCAAIVSTFGLEMVRGYDAVIGRAANALTDRGGLGLVGMKYPERWPNPLVRMAEVLVRPFGASRDYRDFQPWKAASCHLNRLKFEEHMAGAAYSCIATKRAKP